MHPLLTNIYEFEGGQPRSRTTADHELTPSLNYRLRSEIFHRQIHQILKDYIRYAIDHRGYVPPSVKYIYFFIIIFLLFSFWYLYYSYFPVSWKYICDNFVFGYRSSRFKGKKYKDLWYFFTSWLKIIIPNHID